MKKRMDKKRFNKNEVKTRLVFLNTWGVASKHLPQTLAFWSVSKEINLGLVPLKHG